MSAVNAENILGSRRSGGRLRRRGGFTLIEVVIALAVFTIAFVGMMALWTLQIDQNIDTESENQILARGRKAIEDIRALADSQPRPIGTNDRPGIAAVIKDYGDTPANHAAGRSQFTMPLPTIDTEAVFVVKLHMNETAVPRYLTLFGDYGSVSDDQLNDFDREMVQFDLNGDGVFEDLSTNPGAIRVLPVEIGATWRGRHGEERFMHFFTLITR